MLHQNFSKDKFPGKVLYAVKTNPHPESIKNIIVKSGISNFDVASINEIEDIKKNKSKCKMFLYAHCEK